MQSCFCKSRGAPTHVGVPSCVCLIHPLSQHYCFKSCLVASLDAAGKKCQCPSLLTRSPCRRPVPAGRAEGSGVVRWGRTPRRSCYSLGSARPMLSFGTAPCRGTSSATFKAGRICLYPRKPTGCGCILLTSTERHVLHFGILALEYTQLPTFILIKPLLNLLTPTLVRI